MEQYQDQWVKGCNVGFGVRECSSRYAAIRPLLAGYTRPFTVLDLGASLGYFSFRIAEDFPLATVVAIDDDPRLFYQCLANEKPNVIHLKHRMREDDVWQLANCEQFDVVLALNVVHHFERYESVLRSLFRMGDHLVIETPTSGEGSALNYENALHIHDLLYRQEPRLLLETPSHMGPVNRPMWLFETPGNSLRRAYFTAPEDLVLGGVTILSSPSQRIVTLHRKNETRNWIAGINLQTYLSLGGAFPPREDVARMVESYPRPAERHGDVQPWNFILNGQGLQLIDGHDDRAVFPDDFNRAAQMVRESQ
jgi:SAM-dependent methyltransferase